MSDYYLEDALEILPSSRLDSKTKQELTQLILEEDIGKAYDIVQEILSEIFHLEAVLLYNKDDPEWFNLDFRDF
jgi:hypothetical protein